MCRPERARPPDETIFLLDVRFGIFHRAAFFIEPPRRSAKEGALAFSALAYANPPFWIALAQSRDTLGAHMNQALVPSLEGIKYVLDFPADKQPTSKGKNPANFVDLRFVRKLEEEGFFKKLSIH